MHLGYGRSVQMRSEPSNAYSRSNRNSDTRPIQGARPRSGLGLRIRAKRHIRCDCEEVRQSWSDPRGLLMYPDRAAERAPSSVSTGIRQRDGAFRRCRREQPCVDDVAEHAPGRALGQPRNARCLAAIDPAADQGYRAEGARLRVSACRCARHGALGGRPDCRGRRGSPMKVTWSRQTFRNQSVKSTSALRERLPRPSRSP